MSDAANRLAAYYITGSHTTLIGCFRCPVGYVCSDLHWTEAKVMATERELGAFVWRDGEWVFLPTYLRWNAIENPNQGKSAVRLFGQVPERIKCYGAVAEALLTQAETLPQPFRNRLSDIAEQFRNKDQDQEQKKEQEQDIAGDPKPPRAVKARPVQQSLTKAEPKAEAPTTPVWTAYAEAYQEVHGDAPVRNAQVNGQLTQLIRHLGAEEAAAVAAHYLTNRAALYMTQRHPIGLLLRDYQKLRTDWATGRTVNAETARRNEKTQANPFWQMAQEMRRKEQDDAGE
jgi:hypothetical protein